MRHHSHIPREWSKITDLREAEDELKKVLPTELRETYTKDLQPAYPNVDEGHFTHEYAKIIVAVNTGNAEIIPEWNGKKRNMDGMCGPCGNVIYCPDRRKTCRLAEEALRNLG